MLPIDRLTRYRVVPALVSDEPRRAAAIGAAMVDAGLPVAEVTLRTPNAVAVIEALAAVPGLLVGAGTVLDAAQVDRAAAAGAAFVVTPGLSHAVIARCAELDLCLLPGVATPSEIIACLDAGLRTMKFFPVAALGGTATLAAISAPFAAARFVPTGGIAAHNAAEYLALPSVVAVGGTWMVPRPAVEAGDADTVASLVADALRACNPEGDER